MKQLIQNFKTGELCVEEVPIPSLTNGMVLVENKFSLISAGTEKSTVSVGKASLIGKAKMRPDLVKQVMDNIKKEGLKATLEKVKTKLDSLKALGYSTAGIVTASMDTNGFFKPGDRVACAGQDYASHAEMICVPQNLVVKIPDNVSYEEACFTTLGAIAMQGVRQANPTLGENVCVIGLGLLGQITCQLLKANGCNVFGIDVSNDMVKLTNEYNFAKAFLRGDSNLLSAVNSFTNGYGFDKVIITAAAPTNDPIELAAEILRKRGVLIMVGAVRMDIPREPHFYRKELELRMSCSYGPGRYDVNYEELGNDYPYAYVRWTEQRNMEAFLKLISNGAINIKPLITHIFPIEEAVKAYDLILGKIQEPYVGILLKYSSDNPLKKSHIIKLSEQKLDKFNVGFIGAGSFAQSYLIPYVKNIASLNTVVTQQGINSINVAKKFGFSNSSTNPDDVIKNHNINVVFIATQHDTHGKFVMDALKNNKNVFVEKPLTIYYEELFEIAELYTSLENPPMLMVGFNRRFADISIRAKEFFKNIEEPLVMNFRINAGFIPKDHWIQTPAGGGRILGEICHFIDLMQFFTDSVPVKVYAETINFNNSKIKNDDNICITIRFKNGSIGNLTYCANGDKLFPKERYEIFAAESVFVIDDFKSGISMKNGKKQTYSNSGKGHKQEIECFFKALKESTGSPIPFESIFYTTLTTFRILDAISSGIPQSVAD